MKLGAILILMVSAALAAPMPGGHDDGSKDDYGHGKDDYGHGGKGDWGHECAAFSFYRITDLC